MQGGVLVRQVLESRLSIIFSSSCFNCLAKIVAVTRLGDFSPVWPFLEAHYDFLEKMKQPKELATFWASLGLSKFITFSPKQSKNPIYFSLQELLS